MLSLPNILTLSRIFAVPFLVFLLWWPDWELGYLMAFVLYSLAGITDYFDGYLARSSGTVSKLGQFLDPIAARASSHYPQASALVQFIGSSYVVNTPPPLGFP